MGPMMAADYLKDPVQDAAMSALVGDSPLRAQAIREISR
jgi:hypothetical protein